MWDVGSAGFDLGKPKRKAVSFNLRQSLLAAGFGPPSLFAHNLQTTVSQNVHAQNSASARGVLGRIQRVLEGNQPSGELPHRVRSYSIAGNAKVLEGSISAPETSPCLDGL